MFWLDKKCLNGDLRVDTELSYKYHVFEKNHQFVKVNESFYRQNELWRSKYRKKGHGQIIDTEFIRKSNALVKYKPDNYIVL
jgi:vancomycin resistance protein VanW